MYPVCSFYGDRDVVAWFEGPTFTSFVGSSAEVRAEEAWLVCSECLPLVEAEDRDALARRGMKRWRGGGGTEEQNLRLQRSSHDRDFWDPRSSP
ncbi:MAG: hypothetical protein M3O88_07710 [Actinomycetota bacterium]|nr:hypothetical protein [Actinomycetota bacterium]